MNRSSFFAAVIMILFVSLLVCPPPLAAQEKPADKAAEKTKIAKGKQLTAPTHKEDEGTAGKGGAPVIFYPEPLHDFGTIARGSKVSHDFKVVNKGDAPLRLIKAKGS